ncbi:hypothetical protein Dimus_021284 [Dionaea muscipula]
MGGGLLEPAAPYAAPAICCRYPAVARISQWVLVVATVLVVARMPGLLVVVGDMASGLVVPLLLGGCWREAHGLGGYWWFQMGDGGYGFGGSR